jgi:hypothetical protein
MSPFHKFRSVSLNDRQRFVYGSLRNMSAGLFRLGLKLANQAGFSDCKIRRNELYTLLALVFFPPSRFIRLSNIKLNKKY